MKHKHRWKAWVLERDRRQKIKMVECLVCHLWFVRDVCYA